MNWTEWIHAWASSMRAAGRSEETIKLRVYQIKRCAKQTGVDPEVITTEELIDWLGNQGWDRATLRSYRSALRGFFTWATQTKRILENPALLIESTAVVAPNPRPTPERAYQLALHQADERERLMIRLATELGMRRAEVCQVHARDVEEDLLGFSLTVHGKGNKLRSVPMPDDLAREITRRAEGGFLFPGKVDGHLSAYWVGKLVSRLLPEGWAMHSLRHRFATRVYSIDQDLLSTQQLLGHASPATTQAYVKVEDSTRRRLVLAAAA